MTFTAVDGKSALQFVRTIQEAWGKQPGKKVMLFGSWEGQNLPPTPHKLSALKALGIEGEMSLVLTRDSEEKRLQAAKKALEDCKGKDVLLFFSHGFPDEMAGCFKTKDFRSWKPNLTGTVLINCACYNGVTGRWFAPGVKGVEDRGIVKMEDSLALAILDSGVTGYFAGIDPWHGPLAMQVFGHLMDDGLSLGEVGKRMACRLALDFLPQKIHFPKTLTNPKRFSGEGTINRRHNGAGMIFYGDPAFAPYRKNAARLGYARLEKDKNQLKIMIGSKPLVKGLPGDDFMLPMNRLVNYYSVKSNNYLKELAPEVYRVIPLPEKMSKPPHVKIHGSRSGKEVIPTEIPQAVLEKTPRGDFLHIRVPLNVRLLGTPHLLNLSALGIEMELEASIPEKH